MAKVANAGTNFMRFPQNARHSHKIHENRLGCQYNDALMKVAGRRASSRRTKKRHRTAIEDAKSAI
jgi:hypothetical protein